MSIYREFCRLDRDRRRRVALRILHDEKVLEDLFDHFLIQEALRGNGRSISWGTYRRRRKASGG